MTNEPPPPPDAEASEAILAGRLAGACPSVEDAAHARRMFELGLRAGRAEAGAPTTKAAAEAGTSATVDRLRRQRDGWRWSSIALSVVAVGLTTAQLAPWRTPGEVPVAVRPAPPARPTASPSDLAPRTAPAEADRRPDAAPAPPIPVAAGPTSLAHAATTEGPPTDARRSVGAARPAESPWAWLATALVGGEPGEVMAGAVGPRGGRDGAFTPALTARQAAGGTLPDIDGLVARTSVPARTSPRRATGPERIWTSGSAAAWARQGGLSLGRPN